MLFIISKARQVCPSLDIQTLSEYCVWAQKSEKSKLHAKYTYGALVEVSPSFHHHLSQNLLSSTFAPLWTYDENMEFSYNLWMGASQWGLGMFLCVCSLQITSFVSVFGMKTDNQVSQKSDKCHIIFNHEHHQGYLHSAVTDLRQSVSGLCFFCFFFSRFLKDSKLH